MPTVNINRDYVHKTFGPIGRADLVAAAHITINGVTLPESSVRAVLNHGLQILQDAYAGSKSRNEAVGDFGKKLDKLLDGTLGARESSVDPVMTEALSIADGRVRAAMKAKGLKIGDYKPAVIRDIAKKLLDKDASIMETARANVAARTEAVPETDDLAADVLSSL